jgi:RNA polymerase sigma-70 factor (ECF subfamily)
MLLALEELSPLERCAYVLRVVDGLPYAEVATALNRSGPATRQLVRRARKRLGERPVPPVVDDCAVPRFAAACRTARLAPVEKTLAAEVVVVNDTPSPGTVRAGQAAAVLLGTLRRLPHGAVLVEEPVNGEPGLVGRVGTRPVAAFAVQPSGARIGVVLVVTKPARLGGLAASATERAPGRRMP